jgi:hypothetical protein
MPDQWPRALLRAALREVGYDATGTRSLAGATRRAALEPGRGPVRLTVLDQDALTPEENEQLESPVLLLASAVREVPAGSWAAVLRRPFTIGQVVEAVEQLLPLRSEARHPID